MNTRNHLFWWTMLISIFWAKKYIYIVFLYTWNRVCEFFNFPCTYWIRDVSGGFFVEIIENSKICFGSGEFPTKRYFLCLFCWFGYLWLVTDENSIDPHDLRGTKLQHKMYFPMMWCAFSFVFRLRFRFDSPFYFNIFPRKDSFLKRKNIFSAFFSGSKRKCVKQKVHLYSSHIIQRRSGHSISCHLINHHHQSITVEIAALSRKSSLNFLKNLQCACKTLPWMKCIEHALQPFSFVRSNAIRNHFNHSPIMVDTFIT